MQTTESTFTQTARSFLQAPFENQDGWKDCSNRAQGGEALCPPVWWHLFKQAGGSLAKKPPHQMTL